VLVLAAVELKRNLVRVVPKVSVLSFHACGNSHELLTDLLLVSNLSRLF
jgi:hypothetical protein